MPRVERHSDSEEEPKKVKKSENKKESSTKSEKPTKSEKSTKSENKKESSTNSTKIEQTLDKLNGQLEKINEKIAKTEYTLEQYQDMLDTQKAEKKIIENKIKKIKAKS